MFRHHKGLSGSLLGLSINHTTPTTRTATWTALSCRPCQCPERTKSLAWRHICFQIHSGDVLSVVFPAPRLASIILGWDRIRIVSTHVLRLHVLRLLLTLFFYHAAPTLRVTGFTILLFFGLVQIFFRSKLSRFLIYSPSKSRYSTICFFYLVLPITYRTTHDGRCINSKCIYAAGHLYQTPVKQLSRKSMTVNIPSMTVKIWMWLWRTFLIG